MKIESKPGGVGQQDPIPADASGKDHRLLLVVLVVLGLGTMATSGEALRHIERWGVHDWDYCFFQAFSTYRSIIEFSEFPLWNPWYMGGVPGTGNFQSHFPSPWLLLDLLAGPVIAIKLKIVAHQVIGLAGMYWVARLLGTSRLAAMYAAGTFFFSTWFALRVHSGHLTYLSTAFLPYVVALLAKARARPISMSSVGGGLIISLMILQGGIYDVIFAVFVVGPLALIWSLQDRSFRPMLAAILIGFWALGFSAVKLIPVVNYMRQNPRETGVGGGCWQRVQGVGDCSNIPTGESLNPPSELVPSPASSESPGGSETPPKRKATRWDLPLFGIKVFLGRNQRSNLYYSPIQGYGWHEYGAYLGPLAVLLVLSAPLLAFRKAWPWLVIASLCFLTGIGNFAPFAPWTLIHHLPIFGSMHCPSRFLIPCTFAASIAAALVLDAIRFRLGPRLGNSGILEVVFGLLVIAALVDSIVVARHSILSAFPYVPPTLPPRHSALVTVKGGGGSPPDMTVYMLANEAVAAGYEPIEPRVWVHALGDPRYRGEVYFRPDLANSGEARVELVSWSPNTVIVRVECSSPGWLIVNRNGNEGWRANAPYSVSSVDGLLAARVGPGIHVIRFAFRPTDFFIGAFISLSTITLAIVFFYRSFRNRTLSQHLNLRGPRRRPESGPGLSHLAPGGDPAPLDRGGPPVVDEPRMGAPGV